MRPPPSKILCVGRNYAPHAAELGNEVPSEPLLFLKPPSALISSGDAIVLPRDAGRVDFEGEIGVVIGRRARFLSEDEAWDHILGLVPLNDVTARELQRADSQWSRAKGFDTFCPVGELTSLGDIDGREATVVTRVNGEERQRGHTSEMVFSIPFLLAYASRIMTFEPGDIIATGTPAGVGPLQAGDEVEVEILGLTRVTNRVEEEGADRA